MAPSSPAPASSDSRPVPDDSAPPNPHIVTPVPAPASNAPESRHLTIPGTGGTASRLPARMATVTAVPASSESTAPIDPAPPKKDVAQAMAEADTLRTLTRSGSVLLVKRTVDSPISTHSAIAPKSENAPKSESPEPPASTEEKKDDQVPEPSQTTPHLPPGVTIFRRKAKMTDVARIVLPASKRETPEEPEPSLPSSSSAAVIPPSFPVTVATGSIIGTPTSESIPSSAPAIEPSSPLTQTPPVIQEPPTPPSSSIPVVPPPAEESPATKAAGTPQTDSIPVTPEPEKKSDPPVPPSPSEEAPTSTLPKSEPVPEQFKSPPSVPPTPPDPVNLPVSSREKQEFLLSNGERIMGRILSETTDTLFINHETLGVLTIPREQIAKRLIEIILINGDRIVGDVVAETPDCLYIRHASLGMLTVPHKQRSTRVIEAILKDGDRILGEVLAETENFTVIRSATLGTVAVQHTQVAMLNRKIEQIQLKALPPAAPAIENKPAA